MKVLLALSIVAVVAAYFMRRPDAPQSDVAPVAELAPPQLPTHVAPNVSDAPPDFVAGLMKGIVGVEIEITRIEGKWKASQNRSEADRVGVAEGLTAQGDDRSLAMAGMVGR